MAGIICKQCGYENPEGSTICEICAEDLGVQASVPVQQAVAQASAPTPQPSTPVQQPNVAATVKQEYVQPVDDGKEYFVLCPESHAKTILPHGRVTRFFCEGCKKEHDIDGFLWVIEEKEKVAAPVGNSSAPTVQNVPKGDNLWLEELNTHFRIDIDKAGGTLGRYGKYGAQFFQSRNLLTVSGEHCMITYEFGNWVLRHMSRTNQTIYNNMVLGANEPNLLEDGKLLVLANAVTFVVRIG
ncbi:MAG: FHA domain-containing protein [Lachnospiraceae bacterium]|nr:FHA domain-containing protein [Lachnospiraceae bacterium]